ncbi:hypothetical protein LT493_20785 [Streptomyces tricolor]|nr:hypothetical protein [Streptomyces tricolor]
MRGVVSTTPTPSPAMGCTGWPSCGGTPSGMASAGYPVYDYEEPVPVGSAEAAPPCRFVGAALDALGVRWGAAHTEVMLTERGPVLIESGARPRRRGRRRAWSSVFGGVPDRSAGRSAGRPGPAAGLRRRGGPLERCRAQCRADQLLGGPGAFAGLDGPAGGAADPGLPRARRHRRRVPRGDGRSDQLAGIRLPRGGGPAGTSSGTTGALRALEEAGLYTS